LSSSLLEGAGLGEGSGRGFGRDHPRALGKHFEELKLGSDLQELKLGQPDLGEPHHG